MSGNQLFSSAEIGAVAGVPLKAVYKVIEERLPAAFVIRRNRQRLLTRWGALCVVIDREIPKDVPVAIRKEVYARIKSATRSGAVKSQRGILNYVVDVKSAATKMDADVAKYRQAMRLIVEDPAIQGGAATFKGTRILVQHIADLLSQGATATELQEDYPRLTRAMIAAAAIYGKSHPRRGRPRKPAWRNGRPLSVQTLERVALDGAALPH
jgi:uncharacterized protein (DUF433 family)